MQRILTTMLILSIILVSTGCTINRGDLKLTQVIEGQPAPYNGWNISLIVWREKGEPITFTGYHLHTKGIDPNELTLGD